MSSLIVGGTAIKVQPTGVKRDRLDSVDRARAFDNTYRASATGSAKREWSFSTPPVPRTLADFYEKVLSVVTAQTCSGDIIGGSENLVRQSENFGTTWTALGTPTRTAAFGVKAGITFDLIGDDTAAAVEGYEQLVTFTGDGVKAVSLHVYDSPSNGSSAVIRLRDLTAATNRLLAVLGWAAGFPVLTMTTGTYLGYDTFPGDVFGDVFRLKFATTSVTAANNNELGIYPATTSALANANTGSQVMGGVQAENAIVPSSYVKTTTAALSSLTASCCSEILGWTPVRTATGHYVSLDFALHEV